MQTLRAPVRSAPGTRAASIAWSLDAAAFATELDHLMAELGGPLGTGPLRERATELWQSDDEVVRSYVGLLQVDTPEDWAVGFEEHHLGQWYRVLLAGHIRPARAPRDPAEIARRLPELGWSAADARRAARGRPLHSLAESFATPSTAAAVNLVVDHGCKGWLAADDLRDVLQRLQTTDRRAFRRSQDLVPLCEDLWESYESSIGSDDAAVLLPPHGC